MTKTRILTWLVVLLVVINAVTIGTILYHNYRENLRKETVVIRTGSGENMLNGRFFRQTLGFNNEQMNAFRKANHNFRPLAMSLTAGIDSLKHEMFVELQKPSSDTVKLNNMSVRIGGLHSQLKYETYRFFLAMKGICSQEQKSELEKVFQPLFNNEKFTSPLNQQRMRNR